MSGYVKLKIEFLEEILLRDFTPVMIKLLLLIFRLSEGCNKGRYRSVAISLFKKDFEACGISEQSVINALKALKDSNVVYEFFTALNIRGQEVKVCCYAINFNYEMWEISYTADSETAKSKLNQLVSLNLWLRSFQVSKLNNLKRCQSLLLFLEENSIKNYFLDVVTEILADEGDIFQQNFVLSSANDKMCILIGYTNILYCDTFDDLACEADIKMVMLAVFVLDLWLVYEITSLSNAEIEQELIKILKTPRDSLGRLFEFWIENVAPRQERENYRMTLHADLDLILSRLSDCQADSQKLLDETEGDYLES